MPVENNSIIEINNATVVKENTTLLDAVSLSINKHENTVIIGPNGSGKSSLLKLITRDYYPVYTHGEFSVKLFGESVWDIFKLRGRIGIVSDSFQSLYNLRCSGLETILSGFFGSIGLYSTHKITDEMQKKAKKIIEFLGVDILSEKKLYQMSSGEINRFLVGRALVNNPEVLVLDEPTANLDVKSARVFLSYIQKIAQNNTTIIMVTHHFDDIIPEINKVIMMKKGGIFKSGIKEDLLNSKVISELFDSKIDIIQKNGYYFVTI